MTSPVVRIELKRADVSQLVKGDKLLSSCAFVKAMGRWAEPIWGLSIARRYAEGAVLFQQGDASDGLVFVLRGQLRVFSRKGTDSVDLGMINPGEVVGEAEALSGGLRTASVVAHVASDAVEVPRTAVIGLLARCPELKDLLEGLRKQRSSTLDEMTDFINRW